MIDVITRALRHPLDYLPVINRRSLVLQEIIQESEDIYSFIFKPKKPFTWKAGQHGIFYFPNKKIARKFWRAFSIASSAHEQVVRISTIIENKPSDFKKQLKAMRIGDEMFMQGPFGEFHTSEKTLRIVGIAGGIGITPFRSLLYDLSHRQNDVKLTLIYSAKENQHCYKPELDSWCQANPNMQIIYTHSAERVNEELDKQVERHDKSTYYFLSGVPSMIEALRKTLRDKHIPNGRIVNDPFKGY